MITIKPSDQNLSFKAKIKLQDVSTLTNIFNLAQGTMPTELIKDRFLTINNQLGVLKTAIADIPDTSDDELVISFKRVNKDSVFKGNVINDVLMSYGESLKSSDKSLPSISLSLKDIMEGKISEIKDKVALYIQKNPVWIERQSDLILSSFKVLEEQGIVITNAQRLKEVTQSIVRNGNKPEQALKELEHIVKNLTLIFDKLINEKKPLKSTQLKLDFTRMYLETSFRNVINNIKVSIGTKNLMLSTMELVKSDYCLDHDAGKIAEILYLQNETDSLKPEYPIS